MHESSRWILAAVVLEAVLFAAACGTGRTGTGGDEGDPCDVRDDCRVGLACIGNVCTRETTCPAGQTPCGTVCCTAGQVCDAGVCAAACDYVNCNGVCCGPGQVCSGVCCAVASVCGSTCCGADEQCQAGACVACDRPLCGGACCVGDEVCYAGTCCRPDGICGSECCTADQACVFDACHRDCGDRDPCGPEETCCTGDEVCYDGACITPGDPCTDPLDCPEGQYCDMDIGRCLPKHETTTCEYRPPVGEFSPTQDWSWAGGDVMMAPAIGNLTDDNGDGAVDETDIPDIAFTIFYGGNYSSNGTLYVISGDDGHEIFHLPSPAIAPGAGLAIADVDVDGRAEIVACQSGGGSVIVEGDGTVSGTIADACGNYVHPVVADLEGDGAPEIVTSYTISSGGAVRCSGWGGLAGNNVSAVSDVDGDGSLDIVGGSRAMDASCTEIWNNASVTDGRPAIADLDMDGLPEVATVVGSIWVLSGEDGSLAWGPYTVSAGSCGGAPTIADFDGDGKPEIATAGLDYYMVFDLDCVTGGDPAGCPSGRTDGLLWTAVTQDHSSCATGSSVFDFEGDGAAEVVYGDEYYLRIYRGVDGTVLFETPNSTGTLWEYPLIADIDNDEHAEIVVVSNLYAWGSNQGVRAFSDTLDNWVRTRRIWNQHTYHVTNINEDGTVPAGEVPNWTVDNLNNFRQNVQPEGLFDAPDLVPEDTLASRIPCPDALLLSVRLLNQGSSSAPPGIPVAFWEGTPDGEHTLVGVVTTDRRLYPGESTVLSIEFEVPSGMEDVEFTFYVVVDSDGTDGGVVHECLEDNNASDPFTGFCTSIG
jgi:hypothetical protein